MKPLKIKNREEWLLEAADRIAFIIEDKARLAIPKYRVTCSFPDKRGRIGTKKRIRGQCWPAELSGDGHVEIIVTIVEAEPREIIQILAHELIHAGLPGAGHGKPFQKAAKAIGFSGPFTSANTTDLFWRWADKVLDSLPPYPHAELNAAASPEGAPKTQRNRQMKCECQQCGYVARTSRKWIDEVGPPHCPLHGPMAFIDPDTNQDMSDTA